MRALRLVFATDFFPPYVGGVPAHQMAVASGLAGLGHEVDVVTARLPGTPAAETIDGVRVHRVGGARHVSRYGFGFHAIPLARRLAKQADVVQASTYVGALPGLAASRSTGTPSLLTVHEVFLDDWASFLPGQPARAALLRAAESGLMRMPWDAVVAVSSYTQRRLARFGWGPGASTVIPNGIDDAFWQPEKADADSFRAAHGLQGAFVFLFFGRAGISKGLQALLEAARSLADMPGARLVLVLGPGELEAWCRQRVAAPDLRGRVTMLPALDRAALRDAIAAADAVVLPSLSEGFGLAHAEACAMGRPVVSSDAGPLPEVVSGRRLLVPPGDAAALAQALQRAFAGDWQQVPAQRFSWSTTVRAYESEFQRLADLPR